MKLVIACITLACGVIGGAYGVATAPEAEDKAVPTEYIDFQEPLHIRAYASSDLGDAY